MAQLVGGEVKALLGAKVGRGLLGDSRANPSDLLGREAPAVAAQKERAHSPAPHLHDIPVQVLPGLGGQGYLLRHPLPLPEDLVEAPVVVLVEIQGRELAGAKPGIEEHVEDSRLEQRILVAPGAGIEAQIAGRLESHDLAPREPVPVGRVGHDVLDAGLQVIGAVAEFERDIIKERVVAGLANAKRKGKKLGRPRIPDQVVESARKLREEGKSWREIGMALGIDSSGVRKRLKSIEESL